MNKIEDLYYLILYYLIEKSLKDNFTFFVKENGKEYLEMSLASPNVVYREQKLQLMANFIKFKPLSDHSLFSNYLGKQGFVYKLYYPTASIVLKDPKQFNKFMDDFNEYLHKHLEKIEENEFLNEYGFNNY